MHFLSVTQDQPLPQDQVMSLAVVELSGHIDCSDLSSIVMIGLFWGGGQGQ